MARRVIPERQNALRAPASLAGTVDRQLATATFSPLPASHSSTSTDAQDARASFSNTGLTAGILLPGDSRMEMKRLAVLLCPRKISTGLPLPTTGTLP